MIYAALTAYTHIQSNSLTYTSISQVDSTTTIISTSFGVQYINTSIVSAKDATERKMTGEKRIYFGNKNENVFCVSVERMNEANRATEMNK